MLARSIHPIRVQYREGSWQGTIWNEGKDTIRYDRRV